MGKRVLVISYTALMNASANGRTMKSLLAGVRREDISLFCCSGIPDEDACAAAYKVSNKQAVYSILSSQKGGSVIPMDVQREKVDPQMDTPKSKKKPWKYYAKEVAWRLGRWKKRAFRWIESQKPDYVLYMYGDTPSLQNFATEVSRRFDLPLLVYSCEDYCFKDYNYINRKDSSFFFKRYHKASLKATDRLFARAAGLITNSELLGKAYTEKYGVAQPETLMMASDMEFIENCGVREIPETRVVYAGALGQFRAQALSEIAEALQRIDSRLRLSVYGRTSDPKVLEAFSACPGLDYCGFVPYGEVLSIMRSSALLIETVNLDAYIAKDKKFGFSTKYADCFACGTPLLVYAPEEIVETVFAKEHTCAFVCTDKEALAEVLQKALFDEDARKALVKNAKDVTDRYFNKTLNMEKYDATVERILAGREKA